MQGSADRAFLKVTFCTGWVWEGKTVGFSLFYFGVFGFDCMFFLGPKTEGFV